MTAFDIAAVLIVLVSALIGYARGAVKEVVTLVAFTAAALAAVILLPFTGKLLRHIVHPPWAGNACAVLVVFVLTYVALRVLGGWVTQRLHATSLGHLDRAAGGAFGVARALVLLGAFFLVFSAVTPAELSPKWITSGLTWPVARASGRALAVFAPTGMKLAGGVGKAMGEGVAKGMGNDTDEGAGVELGSSAEPEPAPPANETADRGPKTTVDPASDGPRRGLKVELGDRGATTVHKHVRHSAEPDR